MNRAMLIGEKFFLEAFRNPFRASLQLQKAKKREDGVK
jgi:hypothetical protein